MTQGYWSRLRVSLDLRGICSTVWLVLIYFLSDVYISILTYIFSENRIGRAYRGGSTQGCRGGLSWGGSGYRGSSDAFPY
jgi:hypothetical protein